MVSCVCCYIMNCKADKLKQIWPDEHVNSRNLGGAWTGGVVTLDIVDNFIIFTLSLSVVFVISYIYLYFRY